MLLGALSIGLLAWFLWPFLAHGVGFPLGPDAPVYLWWSRLAGEEGLSAVGHRPGAPALTLVAQGALGRTVVEATAALEVALSVATGLTAAALVRRRTTRTGWLLTGALAGTFAVHLAAGYLANLLDVVAFLAAGVALARGTRRGTWVAAGALAAGGLAHPPFFLVGATILATTVWLGRRADPAGSRRIAAATLAAGALVGAGLLSLLVGPAPPDVDTSRDAFLRRAGLSGELASSYRDRFVHRWTRYVQWASVPLAVVGARDAGDVTGRFLRAWGLATVAGVVVGYATGWFPPDRFITFGFVVPILAALGLARVLRWSGRGRPAAIAAAVILTLAMLAGAFVAWNRQEPFLSEEEVRATTIASGAVARTEPGTPLAFLVNEAETSVSFLATRAGNVIRAAVPADRIRDVVVVVPPLDGGGRERVALERLTAGDLRRAEAAAGRPAVVFVLRPFDALDAPDDAVVVHADLLVAEGPDAGGVLEASSPGGIALSSVLVLLFLGLAGYGWARVVVAEPVTATGLAPALGAAALVLGAVALERLGLPIGAAVGAWVVLAVGGGGGYVVWRVLERRPRSRPSR